MHLNLAYQFDSLVWILKWERFWRSSGAPLDMVYNHIPKSQLLHATAEQDRRMLTQKGTIEDLYLWNASE